MTTLISWAGVDQRSPSSLYLASDSRISWGGASTTWDRGQKLFASRAQPHLLGYCGDAFFAVHTLSQTIEKIESQLLFPIDAPPESCVQAIIQSVENSLQTYPKHLISNFSILHAMRVGNGVQCQFILHSISFSPAQPVKILRKQMPPQSDVVEKLGTGVAGFESHLARWQGSEVKATSRAVFSAFCDSLHASADPLSGPPPQLVGLQRQGGGLSFGIIWDGKRYYYGAEVTHVPSERRIKWHNDLFEISDPDTLCRNAEAKPQPRPRGLKR